MVAGGFSLMVENSSESLEVLGVGVSLSEMSDSELIVITLSPLNEIERWLFKQSPF